MGILTPRELAMQIDVGKKEQELLQELTTHALKELKVEIRRTSTYEYHDRLKEKQLLLEGLIARLSG
jgi:hypothetical protein